MVHRFHPRSGKIQHTMEQWGLSATTAKPALQSPQATTTELAQDWSLRA